ncbi:MAG: TonB-dependent siderophore receptor [Gammaproteobacteria bacterium]|nr:TonB-dependent siderophore receptor [Gammaproteobacteria bacterium]
MSLIAPVRFAIGIALAGFAAAAAGQGAVAGSTSAGTLDVIEVVSERMSAGYLERGSDVGFGFPAEITKVPQSVQVINASMLRDLKPNTLSDIVRVAGGVGASRNSVEPFSSFKLRGFTVDETVIDGIRNTNSLNIQAEGLAHIERVEILRGPGGAVYGLGSPGGVINIVTRKPMAEPRFEAAVGFGNFSQRQAQVDLTGPILEGGSLRYRLVGAYEDRDSFVDFVGVERWQISPSLEWEHASGLTLRYQGDFREREGLRYISLPLQGTLIATDQFRLPRSLFTGEPGQGDTTSEGRMHTLTLEQAGRGINAYKLYARFNDTEYDQPSVAPAALREDGRTLNRRFNRFVEEQDEMVLGGQIVHELDLGGFAPIISAGFDYADWNYDSRFDRGFVGPLDLLDPQYGAAIEDIFVLAESKDRFRQLGGYLQAVVEVGDGFTVLAGMRYDRLKNRTEDFGFDAVGESKDSQWSPRIGVSWEARPGVVPYLSYSRTFTANSNFGFVRSPDGAPFGPQQGTQWEAGVKLDVLEDFTATLSVFQLELSNVLTPDPADPFFRIPTGRQRARGLEWIGTWEPLESAAVLWSYAYTDAEVTRDTNILRGAGLDNVPKHTARLWSRYSWQLDEAWVAGISGGAQYSSSARLAIGSDLTVPSFTLLEAGAFLSRGPLVAELKIDNLTNKNYLLRGVLGGSGVVPGDSRRVLLTLAWRP